MSKMIQLAIRLLALGVFLGYMMIWVMMPTNTFWLHWLPRIRCATDSTYFGQQGGNILIYTTPVFLIATLACIYLHLETKHSDHPKIISSTNSKNSLMALWGRPAITRGPLGIITWTELLFLFVFAGLLVWSTSAYIHAMFANITTQYASRIGEKV